jgi:hypothetical protein
MPRLSQRPNHTPLLQVVETLRPDITKGMKVRRARGESFDQIARWLAEDFEVHVSADVVRRWMTQPR